MPEQQKVAVEEWSRPLRGETTVKTLDFGGPGRPRRTYKVQHTPLRDKAGNIIGAGEVAIDVTEEVKAAENLRKSELTHSTILQTAQAGFWLSDMEGKLLEVNDAYCRLSGYTQQELLNMSVRDLEAMETPQDILNHIRFVREHGHHQFESRHRRKDGTAVDVEIRTSYLDIEGGRLVVFVWDISDRKLAEGRLLRQNQVLQGIGRIFREALACAR
jgi:PAS domain S-box-containing protein